MIYLSFKNIYSIEFKIILKTKTVKQKFKYRKTTNPLNQCLDTSNIDRNMSFI